MSLFIDFPSWISPFVIPGLPVRWYAMMYIFAFLTAYVFYSRLLRTDGNLRGLDRDSADSLFFWTIVGLLVGARVGSCLFYSDAVYYLTHPWMIFWPFEGGRFTGLPGMSYHGGVIGGIIGAVIYCRKSGLCFMRMADSVTSCIPFGYTWGRIGNFINAELYGRVTVSPLGMVFPNAVRFSTTYGWVRAVADRCGIEYVPGEYVNLPRWPSQLFEAFFEGIVLGLVIWFVIRRLKERKGWADGTVLGSYVAGYGFIRFFLEYLRQPDSDIGFVFSFGTPSYNIHLFEGFGNISKGQVFCFIMVVGGGALIALVNIMERKRKAAVVPSKVIKGKGKGK